MIWEEPAFWELVLDVIALCLCGTAVIALMRQNRSSSGPGARDRNDFTEVLARLACERMWTAGEKNPAFHFDKVGNIRPEGFREERYHEVESLVNSGLTAEEITERMDIPKGEVALVMKLKARTDALWMESGEQRASIG